MTRTVQHQRRRDAVSSNTNLALVDDRSLLTLLFNIPGPLLQLWKFFDSEPGPERVSILSDANLDVLCESVRWCGYGTFKAVRVASFVCQSD